MNHNLVDLGRNGGCGNQRNPLIPMIATEFSRCVQLIQSLDDEQYMLASNGTGSVGGHVRHNLDFINSFLNGIAVRRIDYGMRERDIRIEADRQFAISRIGFAIRRLNALDLEMTEQTVLVRSEVDGDLWHASSASRELEFVHSHTVHHQALIAEKLRGIGLEVASDFGVAPSTLRFWAESSEFQL